MGQRLRGFTGGTFEWLRKAPWSDPGFSGMWLWLIIFGFLGGITGVTQGTEQINIIVHNTLRVPGHFHATVVGGTTLAFMAVTYYVLPLIFRKRVAMWGMAKIQPFVFGAGISTMAIGMILMGILGMPRRHWDSSFAGAPFPVEVQRLGSGTARFHIDVESDDVDADADRLEALGATHVEQNGSWWARVAISAPLPFVCGSTTKSTGFSLATVSGHAFQLSAIATPPFQCCLTRSASFFCSAAFT